MENTVKTNPLPEPKTKTRAALPKWLTTPLYRTNMTLWLIISDLAALVLCSFAAIWLRSLIGRSFAAENYFIYIPAVVVFIIGFGLSGLYPGIGINPIEEFRRLTITSSTVMAGLTAFTFFTQSGLKFSRLVFLFLWMLIVVVLPVTRVLMRKLGLLLRVWGEPVALLGFGPQGRKILKYLRQNPTYGIRPEIVVIGRPEETAPLAILDERVRRIPAYALVESPKLLADANIQTVILAPTEIPQDLGAAMLDEQKFGIKHLILISSLNWIGGSAVAVHDMAGLLGLEVEHNLLRTRERLFKRVFDVFLMLVCGIVGFPIMAVCAVLIKLDSPGPVFYKHKRIGKDNKDLYVWKFRTMVENAEEVLEKTLAEDPVRRLEWETNHKMKNDPRVTRFGRKLRKSSLDELPQLINILRGEMSFVGPRPIVRDEVKYFQKVFSLYVQVLPGLSGLWQISGRSDMSYESRVSLDEYYIRHWSVWMDIYILVNTFAAVIRRRGAY
jgi:Undecaprenyl-phosphate galactose phosphotransferase WbaP